MYRAAIILNTYTDTAQLQEKIKYRFKDENRLLGALSHSSYINEKRNREQSNERLEFLGDSVLGFVTAEYLYMNYRNLPEGELTKIRAAVVCEKSLCKYAKKIDLGKYLLLGKGEIYSGGRERPSLLADAFEALIAAMYLDGGIEPAKEFVLRFIVDEVQNRSAFVDYKTKLQEVIQSNPEESVSYVITGESGPDHDKRFEVEVHLNSNVIGKGSGRSKKAAEQQAAKEALRLMGIE